MANAQDRMGATPLHCAALNGKEAVLRLLVEAGANLEAQDRAGDTPLLLAIRQGHASVVQSLLNIGASVSQGSASGRFPLGLAVEQGSEQLVQLLLAHGASANIPANLVEIAVSVPVKANAGGVCGRVRSYVGVCGCAPAHGDALVSALPVDRLIVLVAAAILLSRPLPTMGPC